MNGSTGVTKTSPKSEDVLKSSHSNTAGEAPRGSERADPTGDIRPKDEPKASDGWRVLNDGAVQKKHVQAFLERLPEIQAQLLEAQTAAQRALTEFMRKLMPIRMELRRPLMELKADYEYMDEIGVHRASERPKHRWLVALTLLPVIAGEAWINGSFLARGLENGLIGGWTIAAGISLFNVVLLGFFLGAFGRRRLNHRKLAYKVTGLTVLAAVLVVAYSSNLAVAHYRDALGGPDPDTAAATALRVWLANPVNPLKVNDVQSLWLLALGILFTILGIAEGYFFDDPYPGYGKFYGDFTGRQTRYQKLYLDKFDELHEIEREQESRLTGLADEINTRLNDFVQLKGRYVSLPDDPDFGAWQRIEKEFPEERVKQVLVDLVETRNKIFAEYTNAMRDLESLDPTKGT